MSIKDNLPDIQTTKPEIKIPIQQVGVENVEVPFRLESKYGGHHQLIANVSMRTQLNKNIKGISMSRFIRTLKKYLDLPLKHRLIQEILKDLSNNLETNSSFMKFNFRLPINRKSPITNNKFPIYYKCMFEGQYYPIDPSRKFGISKMSFKFFQGVIIQYSSYCPCSAELSKSVSGFPHNQRSFSNIVVETVEPNYVWLEDIIETVESKLKTLPYPIIKREDEQKIAEIAAKNPMFVEDAIRLISQALNEREDIRDWIIKCAHEESIHTSEAIAINWKGIPGGFDERRFI
ncbi:MAG: GTP cyclohydrolase FolE2 [Candidatus Thorarchaeota archaeon]|jgi:GTP cyclohydrolase I